MSEDPNPKSEHTTLSADQKEILLRLARDALTRVVTGQDAPAIDPAALDPRLAVTTACFVTLTRCGELRGCIGSLQPKEPLWQAVITNTRLAAQRDTRFPPVSPDELGAIEIEISVLTPPQPLAHATPEELLEKLCPGRDGVVLELESRRATFLPQVWDGIPDKVRFLERLCQKGGWDTNAWRDPDMIVSTYQVEAFHGTV